MKKGYMMEGKAFSIDTTNTSKPQQHAKTFGQSEKVAKTSTTDEIAGDYNSKKYHSK